MLWFLIAGFSAMFLAHTAPAPFLLEGLGPSRPLWHMPKSSSPAVYLTYDDGPNPAATPALSLVPPTVRDAAQPLDAAAVRCATSRR